MEDGKHNKLEFYLPVEPVVTRVPALILALSVIFSHKLYIPIKSCFWNVVSKRKSSFYLCR